MSEYIKHKLKHLCQWLQGKKVSHNANKTEIIIIEHKFVDITKLKTFRMS